MAIFAMAAAPRLVTFDATGTLMRLRRPIGAVYRDALVGALSARALTRGGVAPTADAIDAERRALAVEAQALDVAFGPAYKARCASHPCFGGPSMPSVEVRRRAPQPPTRTRLAPRANKRAALRRPRAAVPPSPAVVRPQWWTPVVRGTYEGAGVPATTLDDGALFDTLFPPLFAAFGTAACWEPAESAAGVVAQLARWRKSLPAASAFKLGVLSNFDDRLPALLTDLGLNSHGLFDFVLTSKAIGIQKPSGGAYAAAAARAGLEAGQVSPASCVHVGDTFDADISGATAAGWRAIFVASDAALGRLPGSAFAAMAATEHERVPTLGFVPRVLGAPAASALPSPDETDPLDDADAADDDSADDPHVDEADEDGERAWFLGKS
jgi:HAD superfamily hydrolase (TIGR01549 family)